MELIELKRKIIDAYSGPRDGLEELLEIIEKDRSVFPFNEYEYLICGLINRGGLTYEEYVEIRTEYINENPNLWIFQISAPRDFGESFAQTYVQGKCSKLIKPNNRLDPNYSGQYDLWLDGISIEVKASRAVDSDSDEPLYMKALSRQTTSNFLMNFQQLKPQCCDVFIWVAVFRDKIVLWVINSKDILNHPLYSTGQHRGNKGNEGQMHIRHDNIDQLSKFELQGDNLEMAIRKAAGKVD
ncbi:MAG: hypothetical protein A2600_13215 [Candidatus Lambdaproteobacteria bacterium RIFOXYD1_FULL_56_27]|uniref:Restriction endonuclease n=1 Tax=Candidatus Lambdaproteobacteria bacterium RIFOXYD2_FULL_56_26 TaxID=1817773 RepID=A0A1F6GLK5_9PROT|nr:MAG: hypothetical protein A2557_01245 [Candidatus Lambdaproteobacteria bacterium RIFOXYD2_FULL_56_26]OGH03419.1 MAG: hypothetical protein A2426_03020 [Candidatus Lambdaproteobacteria bacterium RIFOXYC1_FULL_56_13]OGH08901.1 MAG: hypothetical protein A2600_13215 [Candidatus Lambdaproteobacteria bacterium RIFOXYD1_FULL_56_27]